MNQKIKRNRIKGTKQRSRLSVFRSNRQIYAQIIDDELGKTLLAVSEAELPEKDKKGKNKTEIAQLLGEFLAKKAIPKGIKLLVFDRRQYRYHGRIKSLADGARKGGLEF